MIYVTNIAKNFNPTKKKRTIFLFKNILNNQQNKHKDYFLQNINANTLHSTKLLYLRRMTQLPLFAGIIASMLHVITGPDHLAAVSPLAIESKRKAWKVGLLWGIGHVAGMMMIGLLVLLFKDFIPFGKISAYSERFVGVVLMGLGIWTLLKIFREEHQHKHPHFHETQATPYIHAHHHEHHHSSAHSHSHAKNPKGALSTALMVGVIHGLAGVAHFLLLLPVLGFATHWESARYIIGFGIGSVLAMSLYALVLGRISDKLHEGHNKTFATGIRLVAGMVALILGAYWVLI